MKEEMARTPSSGGRWAVRCAAALAAVALCVALQAAEKRARIKFSDTKDGPTAPDVTLPTPIFRDTGIPRAPTGGSLEGITAAPFAPSVGGGVAPRLFRQDREGSDPRNKWISEAPDSLSEGNLNRALGVRSFEVDTPMNALTKQGGGWAGMRSRPETPASAPRGESAADTLANSRSLPAGDARGAFDGVGASADNVARLSGAREPNLVIFSDSDPLNRFARGNLEASTDTRFDPAYDPLSNPLGPAFMPRSEGRTATREERFQRILGIEPGVRSQVAGTGIGVSSDPLGVQPDPTRRQLNPVVAPPIAVSGGLPQPGLANPSDGAAAAFRFVRPSWADSPLTRRPDRASSELGLATSGESRRTLSPTILEAPRRPF
jgi:hypothetical protein